MSSSGEFQGANRSHLRFYELIADPRNCRDEHRSVAVFLKFLAQRVDVNIYRAAIALRLVPPDSSK